ncbi:hypothetical protein LRAMOSA02215 [Lichtheimia ramosa]|uniref:Uncharacterized protein n=1 Tax=Lichtheimia ramosa TaxID=688394 RepID=A0A077WNB9_9FUNG|nr:hypothetical protein LRAMOSA02215 [Lichtheimia ramosa]
MLSQRAIHLILAVGIGVGTGVYVFQPLLKEYEAETHGTWMRPGDEDKLKKIEGKQQQTRSEQ